MISLLLGFHVNKKERKISVLLTNSNVIYSLICSGTAFIIIAEVPVSIAGGAQIPKSRLTSYRLEMSGHALIRGIETRVTMQFYRAPASGKTQLCYTIMHNVVLSTQSYLESF